MSNTLFRILYSCQEPTLPLHLQTMWQLNSSEVGLVYIAAALPAMLCPSPWFMTRARKSGSHIWQPLL